MLPHIQIDHQSQEVLIKENVEFLKKKLYQFQEEKLMGYGKILENKIADMEDTLSVLKELLTEVESIINLKSKSRPRLIKNDFVFQGRRVTGFLNNERHRRSPELTSI